MDNSNAKRGGTVMELVDHYFRPDGTSLCGVFGNRHGGAKRAAVSKKKLPEVLSRGGGRPLCFGCEKAKGV